MSKGSAMQVRRTREDIRIEKAQILLARPDVQRAVEEETRFWGLPDPSNPDNEDRAFNLARYEIPARYQIAPEWSLTRSAPEPPDLRDRYHIVMSAHYLARKFDVPVEQLFAHWLVHGRPSPDDLPAILYRHRAVRRGVVMPIGGVEFEVEWDPLSPADRSDTPNLRSIKIVIDEWTTGEAIADAIPTIKELQKRLVQPRSQGRMRAKTRLSRNLVISAAYNAGMTMAAAMATWYDAHPEDTEQAEESGLRRQLLKSGLIEKRTRRRTTDRA